MRMPDRSAESMQPGWYYAMLLHQPQVAAGLWIRKLRQAIGGDRVCSQEKFAEAVGVEHLQVLRWENGYQQPLFQSVRKIDVIEYRLIGLGQLSVHDSQIAQMYRAGAIGPRTLENLAIGLNEILAAGEAYGRESARDADQPGKPLHGGQAAAS